MNELDLASLIASRVCHDLISPVGALSNGVEVLVDETDPAMREHAIALIAKSAEQASAKLKLCRLAYGSMGSASTHVSLGDARDALDSYFKDSKIKLDWRAPPMLADKNAVRLAANMVMAAMDTIPRGGILHLDAVENAAGLTLTVQSEGAVTRLTPELQMALAGETPDADLDGRSVQPYLTGIIARSLRGAVTPVQEPSGVTLSAIVPRSDAGAAAA